MDLHTACVFGDYNAASELIAKDKKLINGNYLIIVAKLGPIEITKLLLDNGVPVDYKESDRSYTALTWASRNGHIDTVRLLIECGADVNNKSEPFTALMTAVHWNRFDIVKLLLDNGADINATTDKSTIMMAASAAPIEIVRYLVERGAIIDTNQKGEAAIDMAMEYGKVENVEYLEMMLAKEKEANRRRIKAIK